MKKIISLIALSAPLFTLHANMLSDVSIPGYSQRALWSVVSPGQQTKNAHYTVQDFDYHQVVDRSQQDITHLLAELNPAVTPLTLNHKVRIAVMAFTDRPYGMSYAQGEGDWLDNTHRGQLHIQQSPIYRTDQFVCNTLVQTILAAVHATSLASFNQQLINNEYGAAGDNSIHYYNRNNFVSGDFNPVNHAHGLIIDKTALFPHGYTSAIIDRQNWFTFQQKDTVIGNNVTIIDTHDAALNQQYGEAMYQRFHAHYPIAFKQFMPEKVAINYIPKAQLVVYHNGSQQDRLNRHLIDTLPTPSVIEIVRDAKKWTIAGHNIKDLIGTELNISHLGVIYRQTFHNGERIYNNITCHYDADKTKICVVKPVVCHQTSGCNEVMYAAATSAYPNGYYYYQDQSGQFQCTQHRPSAGTPYTMCNRVQSMPLGDYFASYQYGSYTYMQSPSILGANIEVMR